MIRVPVPTRNEVAVAETWDLGAIYPDDVAWEPDARRVEGLLSLVDEHRPRMGDSAAALAALLDTVTEVRRTVELVRAVAIIAFVIFYFFIRKEIHKHK